MRNIIKQMTVTLFPVLLLFAFVDCDRGVNPEDLPRLELTVENVVSKEVWLRVKFVNRVPPLEFVVERDGQQVIAGRMQRADTLVIDTTAIPKRNHAYKAIQLEGSARTVESNPVQAITLDTTSHTVQWQVDTLGVRGTIFDVWAFSSNNIWAVGEIFVKDSTGKDDPMLYNAAQWDGARWQIMRIPTRIFNGSLVTTIIRTIIGFSTTDIWFFSDAGSYSHWNGTQWETQYVPERQGGGKTLGNKFIKFISCWHEWLDLPL